MESNQAQISMYDTRIKILIDRHRQHLSKKIEEAFGRTGEEWAAQDVELHISRVDAENRRKEGRGFYKMNDASIQTLRVDLYEDYHAYYRGNRATAGRLQQ